MVGMSASEEDEEETSAETDLLHWHRTLRGRLSP
jgi:hypothetical protein